MISAGCRVPRIGGASIAGGWAGLFAARTTTERLSLARDGRVIYGLRRHWRDGTAAVSFDPLTFIERLTALVPRPRACQHTYHGVLAPAAPDRDLLVPGRRRATAASATPAAC